MADGLNKKQSNSVIKTINTVEKIENTTVSDFMRSINILNGSISTSIKKMDFGFFDVSLNKAALEAMVRDSGYFINVNNLINNNYKEIIQQSFNQYERLYNRAFNFSDESLNIINSLKQQDLNQFTQLADDIVNRANRTMLNTSFGSINTAQALQDITKDISKFSSFTDTWVRTTTQGLFSEANTLLANDNGIEQFEYVGPVDRITRDFCKQHTGEVKTLIEWDSLDNGQISPVSIYRGGFNCRHQLIGVA